MRLIFLSWSAIILTSGILWFFTYGFDNVIREVTWGMKAAAVVFIAAIIINFIAEFGWLGGNKINKSSMYEGP